MEEKKFIGLDSFFFYFFQRYFLFIYPSIDTYPFSKCTCFPLIFYFNRVLPALNLILPVLFEQNFNHKNGNDRKEIKIPYDLVIIRKCERKETPLSKHLLLSSTRYSSRSFEYTFIHKSPIDNYIPFTLSIFIILEHI